MSDYIDREAAIKALCEWSEPCFERDGEPTFIGDYIGAIASIPAADVVEVKHGRWIYNNMGGWHCSECNNQAPFWCMASTQNLSDYCPNCGAKMNGGADDAAD